MDIYHFLIPIMNIYIRLVNLILYIDIYLYIYI